MTSDLTRAARRSSAQRLVYEADRQILMCERSAKELTAPDLRRWNAADLRLWRKVQAMAVREVHANTPDAGDADERSIPTSPDSGRDPVRSGAGGDDHQDQHRGDAD